MKLPYDQNLSPNLVTRLTDLFPDSQHVFLISLDHATDLEIREYARREDLVIVTKDADFSDMCVLKGFPPKIIWIRGGNCSTHDIEALLRQHYDELKDFEADLMNGVIAVLIPPGKEVMTAMRLTEMVSCSG